MRAGVGIVVSLALGACGETPHVVRSDAGTRDTGFDPVDAMMPMHMEMEMEPEEPATDAGVSVDAATAMPDDAGMTVLVDAASLPTGRSCTHSFGGIYADGACSASYRCVDGAWVMRDASSRCSCEEPTGMTGCGTSMPPIVDAGMGGVLVPPTSTSSESIGTTGTGRIERSMRARMGTTFILANTGRNAYWGTEETVFWLGGGFDQVHARHPSAALPQLRDISVELGGTPSGSWPHSSHRSGRDADVTYYLRSCSATSGCPLEDVALADFDAAATWTLFEVWIRAGVAMYIFVDHDLQQPLYEEARRRGASASELTAWFQYPRATSVREGIVRHVDNHRNHFHVRFVCPADDSRCIP